MQLPHLPPPALVLLQGYWKFRQPPRANWKSTSARIIEYPEIFVPGQSRIVELTVTTGSGKLRGRFGHDLGVEAEGFRKRLQCITGVIEVNIVEQF